jgi:hypothetical protein
VELTNEFRVSVPVEDAWNVLTDVERIAPCLPGAQLQEIEGDEYRGVVKVKVGPITAQYKGKATFQSRDDAAHIAVLKAEGRDTRGQGNASALITATLTPDGDGTAVKVETNLTITGKVAQFGRGVLVDVSGKLLTQFVECLEHDLLSGSPSAPPSTSTASSSSSNGTATPPHGDPLVPAAASAADDEIVPAAAARKRAASSASKPTPAATGTASKPTAAAAPAASATTTSAPSATPAGGTAPAAPAASASDAGGASTVRKIDHKASEPVDLLDAAGVPVAKRAIPVVAGVLVILWFLRRRRNQRR